MSVRKRRKKTLSNWNFSCESFSSAVLRGYIPHGLCFHPWYLDSFPPFSSSFSSPGLTCHVSLWPMHVCLTAHVGGNFSEKAAWHFWLVKLNMWQPSSKADPRPSVTKLAFKSTNAHLQLLLLQDHLLWSRAHARAGTFKELLLQGSSYENMQFLIELLIKCYFELKMLTVIIQWCNLCKT